MTKFNSFSLSIATAIVFGMATFTVAQDAKPEDPKPFAGGSGKFTKLVWSDEFDKDGLPNPEKWSYEVGYLRNRELQYYTKERLENAQVKDGNLVITARKDDFKDGDKTYPITSASIISRGKGYWQRGRIEVRAKVPNALGSWPAVWMLPNQRSSGWPRGGEIDILEHVGYDPDKVHFNVHTDKYNHTKGNAKGKTVDTKTAYTEFHIYAVEIFDDRIDFFFDDQKVFTFNNEGEGETSWPFDKPFFVILNLAYGGAWGGTKGVDESKLPLEFRIDYVRVWQ